ncbi:MAG: 50S ribosomal protein L11 methyltransferase [Desulfobaccales bacterium]
MVFAEISKVGLGLEQPYPSGWSYRLAPHLVLSTCLHPGGADPSGEVLLVKSGGAFPPGHPTTRLSLDLLREAMAAGPVRRLLDVGCGAGVLSLAAAALRVPRVVGLDIARRAALATRENARANSLAGAILVAAQGSTECVKGPFDLVLANLPWEVQMEKAAELDRLAAPKGRLIISGFHDNEEKGLFESYHKLGWTLTRRLVWDFRHPELPVDMSFTWVAWLLA